MEVTQDPKPLSTAETATKLGVSTVTVQRWIRDGHFPNARKKGPAKNSPYLIPEDDLRNFQETLNQQVPGGDNRR